MMERGKPAWYTELKEAPAITPGFTRDLAHRIRQKARETEAGPANRSRLPYWLGAACTFLLLLGLWQLEAIHVPPQKRPAEDMAWMPRNAYFENGRKVLEAFPGGEYTAQERAGCWWNLYLPEEQIMNASIRIEAIHKESGLKLIELPQSRLSDVGRKLTAAHDDGPAVRVPSEFHLPVGGYWRFDVYLDDRKLGDVVFHVPDVSWEASPLFQTEVYELRGVPGKLGFIDPGFKAGKGNKYMWHFWGTKERLQGPVSIMAIRQGTSVWVRVFESGGVGSALNGADAVMPSSLMLPEPGLWRIAVLIGGQYFDTVTVKVEQP